MAPGTIVHLRTLRKGSEQAITVALQEEPSVAHEDEKELACGLADPNSSLDGVDFVELKPDVVLQLHLPEGTKGIVIAHLNSASVAFEAGLKPGDVIEEVNHTIVSNLTDLKNVIAKSGNAPILLLVNRSGTRNFLVIEPD